MQEHAAKKDLNTPGGDELLTRLGGTGGLPYFAFLDAQGAMIINANRVAEDGKHNGNIGHPSEPYEIDWFMTMLAKAVPAMTPDERSTIEHWLRTQKK